MTPALLISLAILILVVIPVIVGVIFLARHRGLNDSDQTEPYPPGWTPPPPAPLPPDGPGPTWSTESTEPPSGPPSEPPAADPI